MSEHLSLQRRVQDIALILKDLLKVIKVVSMYPENNPLPQNLKRTFSERLVSLVEDYGDIRIHVQKDQLTYDDETVYTDKRKEEALAALFFETGITSFTFGMGLEVEGVYQFLDVVRAYVNTPGRNADLAAMLWEADIAGLSFTTVEDIALAEYAGELNESAFINTSGGVSLDGVSVESYEAIFEPPEHDRIEQAHLADDGEPAQSGAPSLERPGAGVGQGALLTHAQGDDADADGARTVLDDMGLDDASLKTAQAAEAMGFADLAPSRAPVPDTTLILNDEFKLAEEEEQQVRRILEEDAEFDMWESTVELLKEMLHQEPEMHDFYETVTVCEKVIGEFIGAGHLNEAGQVLRYFGELEEQLRRDRPLWAERLRDARVTAGSRERLQLLAQALNSEVEVPVGDLRRFLDLFDWQALANVTDLLGEVERPAYRDAICDFLASRGERNVDALARGLYDKRPEIVCNAVSVLTRVGGPRALQHLRKVMDHRDRTVRLKLVDGLKDNPDDSVLEILTAKVRDSDHEVRRRAVESIVARRGTAAFEAITDIISDDSFGELDADDQQAVLNAYSVLGGDAAVDYLATLAKRFVLFGGADARFYQQAAFEALSHNRGEKAERLLLKLSRSRRPRVRQLARQAIEERRRIIYGGEDE